MTSLLPLDRKPRLFIGMPVYNGERYVCEALNSIRSQTYEEWSLLISDNASTDHTRQICEEYVRQDRRISYRCNETNLGASRNYNLLFNLSEGDYFKWASHDDVLAPEFLSRCIEVLDSDPTILVCHTKVKRIDEDRQVIGSYETKMTTDTGKPHERFHDLVLARHPCTAAFGVFRRDALAKTPLIKSFVGSDRTLLAELGLRGRIFEIPEYLFYRRDHPHASIRQYGPYERLAWFDPKKTGNIHLPNWRVGLEYFWSVARVPMSWREKISCYRIAAFWFKRERKHLANDLRVAASHVFASHES